MVPRTRQGQTIDRGGPGPIERIRSGIECRSRRFHIIGQPYSSSAEGCPDPAERASGIDPAPIGAGASLRRGLAMAHQACRNGHSQGIGERLSHDVGLVEAPLTISAATQRDRNHKVWPGTARSLQSASSKLTQRDQSGSMTTVLGRGDHSVHRLFEWECGPRVPAASHQVWRLRQRLRSQPTDPAQRTRVRPPTPGTTSRRNGINGRAGQTTQNPKHVGMVAFACTPMPESIPASPGLPASSRCRSERRHSARSQHARPIPPG